MVEMTQVYQLATVAVLVTDQDRALDFYVGVLGFEKRRDAPFGNGQRWIEVGPPGAATTIALPPAGPSQSGASDTGIRLSTTDAAADREALAAAGVEVDPEVMRWPGVPPMFSFRDSEGNTLYVVEQ
ncbi:MAG TPA: VOC family protein [Acidimicrobiales bacterium]|jgi:predicted enzyme related to lactoylglutathione lyase|nr:VOC family protein [Acidimicrobiales bacterium]